MNTQIIAASVLSMAIVLSAFILGSDIKEAAKKVEIHANSNGNPIHVVLQGFSDTSIPVEIRPSGTFEIRNEK